MSCLKGRVSWLAVVAIVVLLAQVAEAQREGGRRGGRRGGLLRRIPSIQLVAESDDVQMALNLTDEQKQKVDEINDQLRDDRREVFDERQRDWRAAMGKIDKLNEDASAKLAEVLDENQQKRLLGISIQVNGASALHEPAVAEELNLTDEQKTELEEARDENMRAGREAFGEIRDLSDDERRAKMQELRADADKKLLTVLTDEQKAAFESLKGEPVEVDLSDFRGGFGGRDGGGRRGGRDRGRDRDNRDNDAADAGNGESN